MRCRPTVRLDRLQVNSWDKTGRPPKSLRGYQVVWDRRVRQQGAMRTYGRVREFCNERGTRIWWQYDRLKGWLRRWRITVVAPEGAGLTTSDVAPILRRCRYGWVTLVELALDFPADSGIDQTFVLRHGKFGKSRRRRNRGGPGQLRFGGRKSGKLVRCYRKKSVKGYRVELEIHSRLLHKRPRLYSRAHPYSQRVYAKECPHEIATEITAAALHLVPKHVAFVDFDWVRVAGYLSRRFGRNGRNMLAAVRDKASISLQAAIGFLRAAGIRNTHRFLKPLAINREVKAALDSWYGVFVRNISRKL